MPTEPSSQSSRKPRKYDQYATFLEDELPVENNKRFRKEEGKE